MYPQQFIQHLLEQQATNSTAQPSEHQQPSQEAIYADFQNFMGDRGVWIPSAQMHATAEKAFSDDDDSESEESDGSSESSDDEIFEPVMFIPVPGGHFRVDIINMFCETVTCLKTGVLETFDELEAIAKAVRDYSQQVRDNIRNVRKSVDYSLAYALANHPNDEQIVKLLGERGAKEIQDLENLEKLYKQNADNKRSELENKYAILRAGLEANQAQLVDLVKRYNAQHPDANIPTEITQSNMDIVRALYSAHHDLIMERKCVANIEATVAELRAKLNQ